MDTDLEAFSVAMSAILLIALQMKKKVMKKTKNKRRIWVKPWIARRSVRGIHNTLLEELRSEDIKSYKTYLRMDDDVFKVIAHELTRVSPSDALMARIRCAARAHDVLETVSTNAPAMTHRHMLQALRTLFDLQKAGSYDLDADTLIKDPGFSMLCQNFKKHSRSLDVNEAIEATKVLCYLGVPVESLIVQTMLQLIRTNINMINIRQIMFLDFLLNRFDTKNHLVDALKLALPLAFQIHLPMELDKDDLPLLREMLSYCCSHDLPDRCINNVVTGLILHNPAIDASVAKSIIWSLCQVNCTNEVFPTRVQLLHICFDILSQSMEQLSYDDVLRTIARLKGRILEKHPEYYHEQVLDATAVYVVSKRVPFEQGLLIARVLARIAHTNLSLVEYLCQRAAADPTTLSNARTNILFGFVNCLSNNNYTPDREIWDNLRKQISQNPVLDGKNSTLPWSKFCLELASLGHFEDKLISRVFSKDFLDEYLSRTNNNLDYLQLLTLHEAVTTFHSQEHTLPPDVLEKAKQLYPLHGLTDQLEASVARGLGGDRHVVRNVALPSGIVADLFIYIKGGRPLELPKLSSSVKIPLERLNLPAGGISVCLMSFNQGCFSMNSNRLRGTFRLILDIIERQGYAAVAINTSEWLAAPAHERTPYLLREIGYKCGEIGMKLSAT